MSNISAKSVVTYAVMPQVLPRLKRLFLSSFGMIAYLLANIYMMVRLLPRDHVYLNPTNIGRFGVRHVVAEAASHLEFKAAYWDRIIIFVVLLSGIVMLAAQIVLVGGALIFDPVWAQEVTLGNMFTTPDPVSGDAQYSTDVAFMLLDRVFGIPGFFCTEFEYCTNILGPSPYPFHAALHSMFEFYSMGLMTVAVLIFLYFVVVVVGETVTTGTPFGERFKNVWVPIRLVLALLLLIPVQYGLNSGQYITLWAAKAGSGFATNGWHVFNKTLKDKIGDDYNPLGERSELVALPTPPDITSLVQAMIMVHGCAYAEWRTARNADGSPQYFSSEGETDLDENLTVPPTTQAKVDAGGGFYIRPYLYQMKKEPLEVFEETTLGEALDFYDNQNVTIYFGRKKDDGTVEATCGKIEVPIVDRGYIQKVQDPQSYEAEDIDDAIWMYGGGPAIHEYYYNLVKQMWFGSTGDETEEAAEDATPDQKSLLIRHIAQRFVEKSMPFGSTENSTLACKIGCHQDVAIFPSCEASADGQKPCLSDDVINSKALQDAATYYGALLQVQVETARESFIEGAEDLIIGADLLDRGWGGAGIWYNTISHTNGTFVAAVQALPEMVAYPQIMVDLSDYNRKTFKNTQGLSVFDPKPVRTDDEVKGNKGHYVFPDGSMKKAAALYGLLKFSIESRDSYVFDQAPGITGNIMLDVINFVFGTTGLLDMREKNASIHPIAQLSAVGKGIVDSAVRNIGMSLGLSIGGGLIQSLSQSVGKLAGLANQLFSITAFIGLTAGVVLYYIIPILPFVFFFFAVGGWVKGLFEAMVGVPLWALAHLRIDGEGIAGDGASGGYFLIFEVFIRPILIVFGLVASMLIFGMQVRILNVIWDLVLGNVGGATGQLIADADDNSSYFMLSRGTLDEFFFTILYAIIVYMMATASFKLIDSIPDNILRWIGAGVKAFGDSNKNPSEQLMGYAAKSGMMQGQRIVSSAQQSAGSLGRLISPPQAGQ